jgi:TonB family protein
VVTVLIGLTLGSGESRAQFARAPIVGMVVDSLGGPIAGAQIEVEGTLHRATTDSVGRFRLIEVEAGRLRLNVRRLGFLPATLFLNLTAAGARQVMVTMSASPELLAPVVVAGEHEVYDARLAGFLSRAEKKANGNFITRAMIERSSSARLADVLRQVPSVRIRPVRGVGTMAFIRGASCPPLVYLDGTPANAGPFDLDLIDLGSVEGIEIYGGIGSVPAEFAASRGDRCGVIAIWSRPFRPRAPAPTSETPPTDVTALLQSRLVYLPEAVDSVAYLREGTLSPAYPDSLFRANVGGSVTVRFIVDTAGLVEMPSVEIVASSHQLFTDAATVALREARFSPAWLRGRRVRQVVSLPFRFAAPMSEGASNRP